MTSNMPLDRNNNAIPALSLKVSGAHSISSGAAAVRNTTAFDTKVISVYATEDVYIALGDGAVVATTGDHFFPKGFYYDFAISNDADIGLDDNQAGTYSHTHISVLQVSAAGTVYISEKV